MKIDKIDKELQQKIVKMMNEKENKAEAIYEAIEMIVEARDTGLIEELTEQNARAAADADYKKRLDLEC